MPVDYPEQLVTTLTEHGDYTERTIRFYREQAGLVLRVLSEVAPQANPSTLTIPDLKALIGVMRERYAVSTQKDYMIALKRMCEINGNYVFQSYRVMFPSDTRPNVDWLSYDQAMELLKMWKSPLDEMIVCLELLHGLRRVEVSRLTLKDIHFETKTTGYLSVRGKGRAGGKLRSVPMHPDFKKSYDRWMAERKELLIQCDDLYNQDDHLLVYLRAGKLHQYEEIKGRAIDDRINQLSNRAGFEFSNHTLRRTFGRELYRSGVEIVVIAVIYGHTSTTQTLKYLGLNRDDMAAAMDIFRLKSETDL